MDARVTNVVFTKNRPLQLEAYLESLRSCFAAMPIDTVVIYKPDLFKSEYDSLFARLPRCRVIVEKNFHDDCMRVIDQVMTDYILFGIDDVVYFDSVDFDLIDAVFDNFSQQCFGFSLRLGPDIEGAVETALNGCTIYSLDWTRGSTPTARYPFELCATVYRSKLVKKVIKSSQNSSALAAMFKPGSMLSAALGSAVGRRRLFKTFGFFYSPNTLESWNCRWCRRNPTTLPGSLFFQKPCASAVQVNTVNVTTRTAHVDCPQYSVTALNEKYRQGYRLDIDFLKATRPTGTHCGTDFFRLTGKAV